MSFQPTKEEQSDFDNIENNIKKQTNKIKVEFFAQKIDRVSAGVILGGDVKTCNLV